MTDDNSSNSGTTGNSGSNGSGVEGSKNQTAKMSMDQAYAYIKVLEGENKKLQDTVTDVTEQLNVVNKLIEDQEKGRMMAEILPRSTYTMEELVGLSAEKVKEIRLGLDRAILPKINSVRFGMKGADLSDRERGLTVGDLSLVTAQKRAGKQ